MSDRTLPTRPAAAGLPANPLAALVARGAKTLPASTGATARAASRADLLILADVSGSMADKAGATRKIDSLRQSLASVLIDAPAASVAAFGSAVTVIAAGAALPEPAGGTALHLGLEKGAPYRRVLVISDGEPDSKGDALRVAARIVAGGTRIDTLFIGSDGDHGGIAFMRQLADVGRGTTLTVDLVRQRGDQVALSGAIRQLALGAPR